MPAEFPRPKVEVNREYDVPYTAGYSIDGKTIYIDRKLPKTFRTSEKVLVDIDKYLIIHEVTEKALEDFLGYNYNDAHSLALGSERAALEDDGVAIDEYYGYLYYYFVYNENPEHFSKTPLDLDLKPYIEDRLTAVIAKMKEIGHIQLK